MNPPSPSLFLLDPFVRTYLTGDETAQNQRHVLSSGANQAFGIPADVDCNTLMRNLALEADLAVAPDLSRLTLRGCSELATCIHAVDKNLIIITTVFPEVRHRNVFIIYDAIDRSLHMIPCAPSTPSPIFTGRVLVARRADDDRSYALVFPGSVYGIGCPGRRHVLFVSASKSNEQWEKALFANFPDHLLVENIFFIGEEVFSHRGRGYWVDLLLGAMYCDCAVLLSGARTVDICYLDLPVGCERYLGSREGIPEPRAFRTIGCVGKSIKFVSITGFLEHVDLVDDRMVRIWRLKEDMRWDVQYELTLRSLREDGEFKGNDLPTSKAPMYPFLSLQEDHVIYFALGDYIQYQKICFPSKPCFWVRVDMSSKTFKCTPFSLTDASIGRLFTLSGNSEGKLAWTSGQDQVVTSNKRKLPSSEAMSC